MLEDLAAATEAEAAPARPQLCYQPKIDLRRRCLAGAAAFADVAREAEQATLLFAALLDDWTALAQGGFKLRFALAMPMALIEGARVTQLAADHRAGAPHWPGLIIEIAEEEVVRDVKRAQAMSQELAAGGIAMAIRDFGTGYSSLASLRDLSFVEIKVSADFVKGCAENAGNAAICQTAIDLAHRLGCAAVAEGIDAMADLQALQIMGCDLGQGAVLAPALPRDGFLALLQQRLGAPQAGEPSAAPNRAQG